MESNQENAASRTSESRKTWTPKYDNCRIINGILWLVRSGALWRELSERYGKWQAVYARFRLWKQRGIFEAIFAASSADADMENLSIDSTSCKVHQSANDKRKKTGREKKRAQAIGMSRGGKNTKIHAIGDGLGNPLALLLSSGNDHDSRHAVSLLGQAKIRGSNVIGDKAYGSQAIREYITSREGSYTIPPKSDNPELWFIDEHVYKERHLIECFFQKIKWFRRIFTCYENLTLRSMPLFLSLPVLFY